MFVTRVNILSFQGLLDYLCEQFSLEKVDRTAVVRSTLTSIGRLRYLQPGTNCIKIGLPGKLILSKSKGLPEDIFSSK